MASGRLNRRPSTRPTIHPGQERLTAPTTNPMAKRFMKAPRIAALLSGKLMGSMIATSRAPKARPQTTPSITRDIVVFGELNTQDRKSTRLELQSLAYLVCRLLLEKKKKTNQNLAYT